MSVGKKTALRNTDRVRAGLDGVFSVPPSPNRQTIKLC